MIMSGRRVRWVTSTSLYGTIRESEHLTTSLQSANRIYRYHTHPNLPYVDYPEGFQGTQIPVYAPTIIKIIEDRVAGRL